MDELRAKMVYDLKANYGIRSPEILSVMLQIPRHKFVARKYWKIAYDDVPVPLTKGSTMSQPFTVAFMTDLLDLTGKEKVLEIGTGSGYQASILSKLCSFVYSIEIIPELARKAGRTLKSLGISNVVIKAGRGEVGWKEKSPFDAIIITAGADSVPRELFEQLKIDGVIVAPIGETENKKMKKYVKVLRGGEVSIKEEEFGEFKFVPFIK